MNADDINKILKHSGLTELSNMGVLIALVDRCKSGQSIKISKIEGLPFAAIVGKKDLMIKGRSGESIADAICDLYLSILP